MTVNSTDCPGLAGETPENETHRIGEPLRRVGSGAMGGDGFFRARFGVERTATTCLARRQLACWLRDEDGFPESRWQ